MTPPPLPAVPDTFPVLCETCGDAMCMDDADEHLISLAAKNHSRLCHGVTRCTCGTWALRNHACTTCWRMVREPYRWAA